MELLSKTLPLLVIRVYWLLAPMWLRRLLGDAPGTSAPAYAAVMAGGGWTAFWHYALPRPSLHGGFWDPEHYK